MALLLILETFVFYFEHNRYWEFLNLNFRIYGILMCDPAALCKLVVTGANWGGGLGATLK